MRTAIQNTRRGQVPKESCGDSLVDIERRERNRSKFVAEAVHRELERQRCEELRRSTAVHIPKAPIWPSRVWMMVAHIARGGYESLLDCSGGKKVRWIPGQGWIEEESV